MELVGYIQHHQILLNQLVSKMHFIFHVNSNFLSNWRKFSLK